MRNYAEIKEKYPQDFGGGGGKAREVHDKYLLAGEWSREESIEAAERKAKEREEWDRIADAVGVIQDAVNHSDPKAVAEALYIGLARGHRTLQAQTVAAILHLLRIYKDTDYDLRNHAAVVAAAQITQFADDQSIYIPLI